MFEKLGLRRSQDIVGAVVREFGKPREFYDQIIPVEVSDALNIQREDVYKQPLFRYMYSISITFIYIIIF